MVRKMVKVAMVAFMITGSSAAMARSYYHDQPVRVEVSPRGTVQITSPYVRNQHRQYERTKRDIVNYPSRTMNRAFRDFDRSVEQGINRKINRAFKRR